MNDGDENVEYPRTPLGVNVDFDALKERLGLAMCGGAANSQNNNAPWARLRRGRTTHTADVPVEIAVAAMAAAADDSLDVDAQSPPSGNDGTKMAEFFGGKAYLEKKRQEEAAQVEAVRLERVEAQRLRQERIAAARRQKGLDRQVMEPPPLEEFNPELSTDESSSLDSTCIGGSVGTGSESAVSDSSVFKLTAPTAATDGADHRGQPSNSPADLSSTFKCPLLPASRIPVRSTASARAERFQRASIAGNVEEFVERLQQRAEVVASTPGPWSEQDTTNAGAAADRTDEEPVETEQNESVTQLAPLSPVADGAAAADRSEAAAPSTPLAAAPAAPSTPRSPVATAPTAPSTPRTPLAVAPLAADDSLVDVSDLSATWRPATPGVMQNRTVMIDQAPPMSGTARRVRSVFPTRQSSFRRSRLEGVSRAPPPMDLHDSDDGDGDDGVATCTTATSTTAAETAEVAEAAPPLETSAAPSEYRQSSCEVESRGSPTSSRREPPADASPFAASEVHSPLLRTSATASRQQPSYQDGAADQSDIYSAGVDSLAADSPAARSSVSSVGRPVDFRRVSTLYTKRPCRARQSIESTSCADLTSASSSADLYHVCDLAATSSSESSPCMLFKPKLKKPTTPETPGVRRSQRTRVKPLAHHMLQRPRYQMLADGTRELVGVTTVKVADRIQRKYWNLDECLKKKRQREKWPKGLAHERKRELKRRHREGFDLSVDSSADAIQTP